MSAWFCSGPPRPKRKLPTQYAIQLSMIVVITSCAPTVAFRKPATAAMPAPASIASAIARKTCGPLAMPAHDEPTHTETIAPVMYWPWPPMLKRPQRNANATARPVQMSVVVRISVCVRLKAASAFVSVFHQKKTWWCVNGMSMW